MALGRFGIIYYLSTKNIENITVYGSVFIFEKIYKCSTRAIQNSISKLEQKGYIKVVIEDNYKRKIFIPTPGANERNFTEGDENNFRGENEENFIGGYENNFILWYNILQKD